MPDRKKRAPVIPGQLHQLSTSGGRLFKVTVEGPRLTLSDTMVAAPRYLRVLEEQFESAGVMLKCFLAWEDGASPRPGDMTDDRSRLIKRWVDAHHIADIAARQWLSEPGIQSFRLTLAVE